MLLIVDFFNLKILHLSKTKISFVFHTYDAIINNSKQNKRMEDVMMKALWIMMVFFIFNIKKLST